VALRGRLVVAPPLRERKTVMNPGIEFDFTGSVGPREQGPELLDHRQRRQLVVFSASNVELALHLAQREMGALFGLADEPGSVEGSSGGDAVRITRGRGLLRRSYGKFRRANLRFAPDSPLEEEGFEPSVPPA